MIRLFFPVFISILVIAGCAGHSKEKKAAAVQVSQTKDSTYIFDGRTLDGWEITNFGPQGPVYVSGESIVLGMGDGCTGVTCKRDFPVSDYEVTLDARRVEGNDFFCGMTFPVGTNPCTLIVGGWGGTVVGLSSINGRDASENETTRLMTFEKNRWYHIRLDVTSDSIHAWIDSTKVVGFGIDDKRLSIRPEVGLSKPFGIASWRTTAEIRNIRLLKR